jgi:hypothetical protein
MALMTPPPIRAAQVDLGDPYHVYRWCRRWGVTESQLRTAVRAVGEEVRAVESALRRARAATPILVSEHRLPEDAAAD